MTTLAPERLAEIRRGIECDQDAHLGHRDPIDARIFAEQVYLRDRTDLLDQVDAQAHALAEHARLHAQLNVVLHPDGNGPDAPALCDLVAFVANDLRTLRIARDIAREACDEARLERDRLRRILGVERGDPTYAPEGWVLGFLDPDDATKLDAHDDLLTPCDWIHGALAVSRNHIGGPWYVYARAGNGTWLGAKREPFTLAWDAMMAADAARGGLDG